MGCIFYMRVLRGNHITGVDAARQTFLRALATGRPTLVCANHLTMVDSLYLHHGLGSMATYLTDFRRLSWNVPAVENFAVTPLRRAFIYLSKCIPIDRAGDAAHHVRVLDRIRWLASQGEVCTLFPEGGRSRSGRVEPENITYGVGQVLQDLENPQVICAYLRGERQDTWGVVPARGDTLHLTVEVIEPTTKHSGLRGARDLSRQVAATLKSMEDAYFARVLAEP